jgi:hypothetical protein
VITLPHNVFDEESKRFFGNDSSLSSKDSVHKGHTSFEEHTRIIHVWRIFSIFNGISYTSLTLSDLQKEEKKYVHMYPR